MSLGRLSSSPVIVPGGVPMQLTATGEEKRRGLTLILHDASKSSCELDVRSEGPIEQCGEGMPGGGHSNRYGESDGRENQGRCPHGRTVDATDRDEFVDDENEQHDADSGCRSSGGRQSEAGPGKAAEGCPN